MTTSQIVIVCATVFVCVLSIVVGFGPNFFDDDDKSK